MIALLIGLLFLIDQGDHGVLMRWYLDSQNVEYTYYEMPDNPIDGIASGLHLARTQGYKTVVLPWILIAPYPEVIEEMRLAQQEGIEIFICAGYGQKIDPAFIPLSTVVAAVDDNGNLLPNWDYSQAELLWPGCAYGLGCSNSLAVVRAGLGF